MVPVAKAAANHQKNHCCQQSLLWFFFFSLYLWWTIVVAAAAAVELAGTGNIDFGGTEQHHCWFDGIALLVDGIARVPDQSEHSEPWGYCLLPREHACHTC